MNRQLFLFRKGMILATALSWQIPHRSIFAPIAALNVEWMKTFSRSLILILIAWSVGAEATLADEHRLPSQKQAAVDFSLAGLKIGMSQEEAQKVLPRLQTESAAPNGSQGITELDSTEVPAFVQIQVFVFQDQVCAISVIYDSHTTKEMGGSDAILAQLKTNLGIPEADSSTLAESASWIFTKEHRVFKYIGGSEPFFTLKDPTLFPEIKKNRPSPN